MFLRCLLKYVHEYSTSNERNRLALRIPLPASIGNNAASPEKSSAKFWPGMNKHTRAHSSLTGSKKRKKERKKEKEKKGESLLESIQT